MWDVGIGKVYRSTSVCFGGRRRCADATLVLPGPFEINDKMQKVKGV